MSLFTEKFDGYASRFNGILEDFCATLDKCEPEILSKSLQYSLKIGGKRIRPVLMYTFADLLNVEKEKVDNFALALEMIHTYSLIHDDMPEMDNDDFRRGKPSNHKVFGAANALLAGDGLLNTAYSVLFDECRKGVEYISAASFICDCAGIYGMIAGQSADLLHEHDKNCSEKDLGFIYENKTAKLITAPIVVPAILSGSKYYSELNLLGYYLGLLFQITDDILDVEGDFKLLGKSIGKDKEAGKCTAVAVFGLHEAKLRADILTERCLKITEGLEGDVSFIKDLITFVRTRSD